MTATTRVMVLSLALISIAGCALANVVTITPTSPGDWSWFVYKGAGSTPKGYFSNGGVAPAEGNPFPTGNGAFYGALTFNGEMGGTDQPDQVWLGVDRHNNLPLEGIGIGKIAVLQYTAYNGGQYTINYNGNGNPRRHPKQPFQVNLAVRCPTTGDRRLFVYRPWGQEGWGHWNLRREWITYDVINNVATPNFGREMQPGMWYEIWTGQTFYSWLDLVNFDPGPGGGGTIPRPIYGEWTLVPTSTFFDTASPRSEYGWKSAKWDDDPRATGTGKALNLQVGPRRGFSAPPYTGTYESANFKGYVDTFTLGIDYGTPETPDIVETTYDFASENAPARVVDVANIGKSYWKATAPYGYPYAAYATSMRNQDVFNFRFTGQVMDLSGYDQYPPWSSPTLQLGPGVDPDTGEFFFTIWDKSYAVVSDAVGEPWAKQGMVNVRLPYQDSPAYGSDPMTWPVLPGEFVTVQGFLYDRLMWQLRPPAEMTGKIIANYSR